MSNDSNLSSLWRGRESGRRRTRVRNIENTTSSLSFMFSFLFGIILLSRASIENH